MKRIKTSSRVAPALAQGDPFNSVLAKELTPIVNDLDALALAKTRTLGRRLGLGCL